MFWVPGDFKMTEMLGCRVDERVFFGETEQDPAVSDHDIQLFVSTNNEECIGIFGRNFLQSCGA